MLIWVHVLLLDSKLEKQSPYGLIFVLQEVNN